MEENKEKAGDEVLHLRGAQEILEENKEKAGDEVPHLRGTKGQSEGKNALVTGATSGIGLAIARKLLEEGWQVWGMGRDTGKLPEIVAQNNAFHPVKADFMEGDSWLKAARRLIREIDFDLIVNNAGTAYYGLHEELTPEQLSELTQTNLTVPMILTGLVLPLFKRRKGTIIFIASETVRASANPHGAAYGATKAGLLSFANSIFAEGRKCGLRVTVIAPDMTRTDLYRHADFEAEPDFGASLSPDEVAEAVFYVLTRPEGVVIPELAISPQKHRIRKKK